jgi:hypothetical protein
MKSLKRVMAGEYSRELSAKVYEGQKKLSMLGFTMGGHPGYGLRRVLVSETGSRKQSLQRGELKSLAKDRVILAPGPPEEVACVREIFLMYTELGMGTVAITHELNRRNIPSPTSGKWVRSAVRRILMNPKYAGCMVYGKRAWKLCSNPATLPPEKWIVTPCAFEPILDNGVFEKAQEIRSGLTVRRSNEDILNALRKLIASRGGQFVFSELDKLDGFPNLQTYHDRFGSMRNLCELLGYTDHSGFSKRAETYRRIRQIRNQLMHENRERRP